MSALDFELYVVKTIVEHAEEAYLTPLALWRLSLAMRRIQAYHDEQRAK